MNTKRSSQVSEVRLFFDDKEYVAKLDNGNFKINSPNSRDSRGSVANYSLATDKISWEINHSCGARGFRYWENDKCHACEKPFRETDKEEDKKIASFYGDYSPEFEKFIKTELGKYLKVGINEKELEAMTL